MHFHAIGAHVKRDIGHVQKIIGKVFLYYIALIAATDHEIIDAMGRENFHDVPQNRLAADFDHWLGLEMGLLGNA